MLVAFLASAALTALVLMLAFPETPTGKWLHRILVEAPVRFLMDFTWAKFGKALLLGAAFVLLASMGPEMMFVLAASGLDAAAFIELMIIVWLVAASGSVATAWRTAKRIFTAVARLAGRAFAPRKRARSSRPRKLRPQRKNDDQAEPEWAFG